MNIDFESLVGKFVIYEQNKLDTYPSLFNYKDMIYEMKILEISPSKRFVKIEHIPGSSIVWYDIEKLSKEISYMEKLDEKNS